MIEEPWCSGLTCLPVTQKIAGSNPVGSAYFLYPKIGNNRKIHRNNPANISRIIIFYLFYSFCLSVRNRSLRAVRIRGRFLPQ